MKEVYTIKVSLQNIIKFMDLVLNFTEALAEVLHKQIRLDLDIVPKEGHTLNDVQMKQYVGCRYSPGYAACPDLAMNRDILIY